MSSELLFRYLEEGITQYHLTLLVANELEKNGYKKLDFSDNIRKLAPGRYYIKPYLSCLFAFDIGKKAKGIRIAACHTDFPMLKLKTNPEMDKKGYLTVNQEPYGGLISSTWFDRPLGLAGKVVRQGDSAFNPVVELYDSKRPLFMIPSLAPHLRSDNGEKKIDVFKELVPVGGFYEKDENLVEELLGKDVLAYDIYLYNMDKPVKYGVREELFSSPRIDNISSAAAITEAMISDEANDEIIKVGAYFDNEEIGSATKQGADSTLFRDVLSKVLDMACAETRDELLGNIFIASLDVAHGLHPNYPEKSDTTNEVRLGKGVVLKQSASQRYVSDSEASAVISFIANKNNIEIQKQANRTGMPGGKTLGPIISGYIPSMACDMGIPVLAMHSANETACIKDYESLVKLVEKIFTEE